MYGMPYICHSVREYKTRVWDAIHALYLSMSYCVNSSCHAWWTLQWLLLQHAFQWSVPEPLHLQYFAYAYHLLSRWRLRTLPGPPVGWLARAPAKVMSRMMRHRAFRHWVDTHGLIYRVCADYTNPPSPQTVCMDVYQLPPSRLSDDERMHIPISHTGQGNSLWFS